MKLETIILETGSELQKQAKERLLAILQRFPQIDEWTFTQQLIIKDEGISFSHPVLTIGARQLLSKTDDNEVLSIYVHENLHWFATQHLDYFKRALDEIHQIFPNVKVGNVDGGARNEESTYNHLIVCYLEYLGLCELLSVEEAKRVLQSHAYYQWIYKTVLHNTDTFQNIILSKYNLEPRKKSE